MPKTFAQLTNNHAGAYHGYDSRSHLPCFIERITVRDHVSSSKRDIRTFIKGMTEYISGRVGMALFSVTEEDRNYDKWLKVAEEEGYTVVRSESIHDVYDCWAIFVPVPGEVRKIG